MKCPVCKTPDLLMTERQSIEIDYCPTCRGVWLDRGELDKLVAQTSDFPEATVSARPRDDDERYRGRRHDDDRRSDDRAHRGERAGYRKKRSLFDMFDFG